MGLRLDNSTLDKPYAEQMDLVTRHWSGKHGAVVKGINLLSFRKVFCRRAMAGIAR